MTVTSVWKPTSTTAATDAQEEGKIAILLADSEIILTEDDIRNVFQDTSLEEELETKWLQVNFQALQKDPSSLQDTANIMLTCIHHQKDANFPVKIVGIDATILYDTGVNINCMLYMCYMKLKDPPPLKPYLPGQYTQLLCISYVL